MTSANVEKDDPFDAITTETLDGWIRYDSSRSSTKDLGQQLGRSPRDQHTDSWSRFEHG